MKQARLTILSMLFILLPTVSAFSISGVIQDRQAVFYNADNIFQDVKVFRVNDDKPVASAVISYGDARYDLPKSYMELLNLPRDWQKIEALGPDKAIALALEQGRPLDPLPKTGESDPWFMRHPWLSLFFVLLGFYAVFAIGISGGPNHGEHPFILNVCHLVGFLFLAKAWDSGYYYTYLTMLVLALCISMYVTRIRIWDQPIQSWIFKGLMIGCYITMFFILNSKTYTGYAAWNPAGSIQFYVPKQDRGPVQVLGEKDKVLAEFFPASDMDCRIILFWNEKEQPKVLKVTSPRRGNFILEVRRPASP